MGVIPEYLKLAKEGFDDRTIMIWMEDETEQALMCALGCDGSLTTDPMEPEAGVYYSCTIPSKLGWYIEIDTEMGERVLNEDTSYTYPITVTLRNIFTGEDLAASDDLLTGKKGGKLTGSLYMFAPAEGTVSDFTVSKRLKVGRDNYHKLDLGYIMSFDILPGETITITYNVTTAPGAEEMLVFSKTPTLQAYH